MRTEVLLVIAGMALVTYLTRVSLLILVGRVSLPAPAAMALRYIPVGIITALVVPAVLVVDGRLSASPANPFVPAALVSGFVAARWKNALLAMCSGVITVALARAFLGSA